MFMKEELIYEALTSLYKQSRAVLTDSNAKRYEVRFAEGVAFAISYIVDNITFTDLEYRAESLRISEGKEDLI